MSTSRGRSPPRSHRRRTSTQDEEGIVPATSRQLEAFGRTLGATASQLIGVDVGVGARQYQNALGEVHRELRRPVIQRSVFSLAKINPRQIIRTNVNTNEIQQRALSYLPDDLLRNIPEPNTQYSLFQGFQATQPEDEPGKKKKHGRHGSKGQKMLEGNEDDGGHSGLAKLKQKKHGLDHRFEMMAIRKNMCVSEIMELDKKIVNLNTMRKTIVERLAALEQEETDLEHEIAEVDGKLEDLTEQLDDAAAMAVKSPVLDAVKELEPVEEQDADDTFMSESVYGKLSSPKSAKKRKNPRRVSMPILHEHMGSGIRIREFQAHEGEISAIDFDAPFGLMVSAGKEDVELRVWDLNSKAGRCIGMLEGHLSSIRCLQIEENLVASGSMDASIKLWNLSEADYSAQYSGSINNGQDHDREEGAEEGAEDLFTGPATEVISSPPPPPAASSMADCLLYTLSSHVAEVTALHMNSSTLVSGSADKTLRQWDLETGRCVQTLDVLWAAAQASAINPSFAANTPASSAVGGSSSWFRPTSGRLPAAEADFVGALQCFQTAVAAGTADSIVHLFDLRSGQVARSLIGHTGPITALQFNETQLVTGSRDRSIRIWDLRTGSIVDAFAYDNAVTSMMFDQRRICTAAGENVVKVYDKADGRHWDCGAGAVALEDEETTGGQSTVEKVRVKDGYMVEGRRSGIVGVWSC